MWTRADLKEKAKKAFARSRWGLVLCGLIITLISGGLSGGSSARNSFNTASGQGDASAVSNPADISNYFKGIQNGDIGSAELGIILAAIGGIIVISMIIGIALSIFLCNPLLTGCYRYFLEASFEARTAGQLGIVGFAFKKGRYGKVIKTLFLMQLYEFLWSLLFIIPGIIKSYEYRMIPYIMAENPEINTADAFALSKEMMTGNKWAAFVLDLSFIGWHLLAILTCGILEIFYVVPYEQMTDMFLYDTLKKRASIDYFDKTLQSAFAGGYSSPVNEYQPMPEAPLPEGSDTSSDSGWMPVYNPNAGSGSNSGDSQTDGDSSES